MSDRRGDGRGPTADLTKGRSIVHFQSFAWLACMAGTVAIYWILPDRWRNQALAAGTLGFVAAISLTSAAILATFTIVLYVSTRSDILTTRRALMIGGLLLTVLAAFKIKAVDQADDMVTQVAIPLGLSYYTFRCLHYLIEKYKGTLPKHDFQSLVYYLLFLPTIVVGPIHRFPTFLRDLRRKRWDGQMLSEGMERILYGYAKITILGNYLVSVKLTGVIEGIDPSNEPLVLYLTTVRHGLNLYFQFSGFSDIAIGFARLLGYRVIENFNWPYFQKNISDFWRCWHISLSSWCREYVYAITFSVTRSPALGAIATLVAIGLWHSVSYHYILWGLYHGVGIVAWQQFQKLKAHLPTIESRPLRLAVTGVSILVTVHFVWFSFIIVSQPDLAAMIHAYRTLLLFWI